MNAEPIVIVGAGGFGREVLDVIDAINSIGPRWKFQGFLDDGQVDEDRLKRIGAVLIGPTSYLKEVDAAYVIGIGSPRIRESVDATLQQLGARCAPALLHPASTVGRDSRFGDGTVVTAGVRVTTNVQCGRHVHLNLNTTVGHDAVLEDYVTVFPGVCISGEVRLERGVSMGTGSSIIQGRVVGQGATIGAGAAVVRDVPPAVTAVGVPARPLSS